MPPEYLIRLDASLRAVTALSIITSSTLVPAQAHADQSARRESAETSLWPATTPTFSWTEGAATVCASALTVTLATLPQPPDASWRGGILWDDAVRRGIRLDSAAARHRARGLGDLTYYASPLLPLLIDPLVIAWMGHGDGKAALNLELVGLEAFAYAGLSSFISTRLSTRERPDATACREARSTDADCEMDTESFWSGHTTISAASAGLVCANHGYLRLWGSALADGSACGLALTSSLITAISRLAADRHYSTDVIAGLGVGFAIGYGVPVLLHYTRRKTALSFALTPSPLPAGGGFNVVGTF